MLIELAPHETARELDRLITCGVRKGFLDLDRMRTALVTNARRPGTAKLRKALGAYLPTEDRKSDLERDFDAFLREHPEIPPPAERNVYIDGWEIDCYWPEYKLAVELDGRPYHIAVREMEKDRYKDAKLLIIGIRTFRITGTRFNQDRAGVYDDLMSLLDASQGGAV
jgi:very-short-patch-repair endonuclease